MAWEQWVDSYRRTARLSPALLVTLPLIILVLTSVPTVLSWWVKAAALVAVSSLPFVIMQVVRDRGRYVERDLFHLWDGAPTTTMLRWSGPEPRAAVSRRHLLLAKVTDVRMPTAAAESANPGEAEEVYAVATTALRELTRDSSRFDLLQHELKVYGFRRNVFGCRTLGLVFAVTAAITAPLLAWSRLVPLDWKTQVALIVFDCVWALGWWRICTRDWVRRAADNYARQLFASLEVLGK